ncbi:cytochrome-c peroxidase [Aquimarina muelleri]|uniref:Cytochrome-c peroxidase n=1 Tax=Aquimarina muelleri TaxID=279356 RepID=A0A918JSD7_9FLAO|nr:cytochrome c peroxidase [Aquimarina muelleri]MCX2761632.1 c-type cytochrome [Aquimarina muelleri]GGX07446.1 cytochrome-c peroxidase [Aquimarina muelleri]
MKNVFQWVLILALCIGCKKDSKQKDKDYVPVSIGTKSETTSEIDKKARKTFGALPKIAENKNNPIFHEKVVLGKKLYYEKRLSKDNTQSCNTCHNLKTYGVDNLSFSIGNDGKPGGRNSPTTLNAALHISQFWDGREPDVEAQAGGPILNPIEMAMPSEKVVVDRISKIDEYIELFGKAFPKEKQPITYKNIEKAIGAFERKLITPSKFDTYIAGENSALNKYEKQGMETFISVGCTTCHSGALLGGDMYQKFGLTVNYWDHTKSKNIDNGKFDLTKNEADKYVFKVPSLRNIEKTAPYFHDGSVQNLRKAIAIMGETQLNQKLSSQQVNEIHLFLQTLTGEVPQEALE